MNKTVLSPSHEILSSDDTSDLTSSDLASVDLNGDLAKAWLGLGEEEQLTRDRNILSSPSVNGGFQIKNEPLSPPPSSDSSETSSESSQTSVILQNGSQNHVHIKLESPPLTPPRDSPMESSVPLGVGQQKVITIANGTLPNGLTTKSLASGVINGTKKGVAIAPRPKPRCPIAPKVEPVTTAVSMQSTTPTTVTVKHIPATVGPAIVVKQNSPSVFSPVNGSCSPPPAKQAKVIPLPLQTNIPSPPQPVAVVTQPCPPDVDVKAWKRQQRMIKNRESACLSRKKKKEYLQELEYKAIDMEKEIERLKSENTNLRNRVESLVKENTMLKKMQSSVFSSPAKTASCLLAIVFIIGFNLAPVSLFGQTDSVNSAYDTIHHSGRALLEFSQSTVQNASVYSRSHAGTTPPLDSEEVHILRTIINQSASLGDGLSVASKKDLQYLLSQNNLSCPHQMNVSETIRLTDVLQFWAKRQAVEQTKSTENQRQKKIKKKRHQSPHHRRFRSGPALQVESDERALQLYDHLFQQSYDNLLDALNRREDTFYVVSFRKDHLLLPATAHNNTHRPKMSLVMPTVSGNESIWNTPKDHISMMQIDCEVIDTRVVHVKDHGAPPPVVRDNSTFSSSGRPDDPSMAAGETSAATSNFVSSESEHKLGYHPRNVSASPP
ncbi:cyclic AMP-dependent transcription factor ATF-6 beta-like [Diadema antillarum]|uniref:cyclic AMP-dependent transcription factor ATF-6 beta-like n=1 Tax=Diadema antillarum TaxID=105358 RepID=UPI003A891B69